MDLELTEEQQLLQDMAGNLLAEESSVASVREMEDDPRGFTDSL